MVSNPTRIVYSALFGGYEDLQEQPLASSSGYKFVLYTDRPTSSPGGWEIRRVAPRFPLDPVRSARYLKIRGNAYVHEFDESLWIDNRVVLRGDLDRLFGLRGTFDIAIPAHSYRGELREEFRAVIDSGFDDPARIRQMYKIADHFEVLHMQTLWTGMLIRGKSDKLSAAMERWLELLLLASRRDQLSVHCGLTAEAVEYRTLELDNYRSEYHRWIAPDSISRSGRIRFWRPEYRRPALRVADHIRSSNIGRAINRRLNRTGLSLPRW